jgi:hypothetical protein
MFLSPTWFFSNKFSTRFQSLGHKKVKVIRLEGAPLVRTAGHILSARHSRARIQVYVA